MPTITTIEEFNELDKEHQKQITIDLNKKYFLYHFAFQVLLIDNSTINGKATLIFEKEDNNNLFTLERLEELYLNLYDRTKQTNQYLNVAGIMLLNKIPLYITAYSYFKLKTNPKITYQEYPL